MKCVPIFKNYLVTKNKSMNSGDTIHLFSKLFQLALCSLIFDLFNSKIMADMRESKIVP